MRVGGSGDLGTSGFSVLGGGLGLHFSFEGFALGVVHLFVGGLNLSTVLFLDLGELGADIVFGNEADDRNAGKGSGEQAEDDGGGLHRILLPTGIALKSPWVKNLGNTDRPLGGL